VVAGWLLFAVFVTGTLAVYDDEIDAWMRPEVPVRKALAQPDLVSADRIAETLQRDLPPSTKRWIITLPGERRAFATAAWFTPDGQFHLRMMNPITGQWLNPRETAGGDFFFRFHYRLSMPGVFGKALIALVSAVMLAALMSGIIIHKRIFRDLVTFRPRANGRRVWLDGHVLAGVLFLPFHLIITYSGIIMLSDSVMPSGLKAVFAAQGAGWRAAWMADLYPQGPLPRRAALGESAPLVRLDPLLQAARQADGGRLPRLVIVENPGDRAALVQVHQSWEGQVNRNPVVWVYDGGTGELLARRDEQRGLHQAYTVLAGLHRMSFADPWLRGLMALGGLAGAAMIGSGLVLFARKQSRSHPKGSRSSRFVGRGNVGALAGLGLAVLAFFYSNRLLPVEIPGRQWAEVGAFAAVWLLAVMHGVVTPALGRAWRQQGALFVALALGLPLLDLVSRGQVGGLPLIAAGCGLVALAVMARWSPARLALRQVQKGSPQPLTAEIKRRILVLWGGAALLGLGACLWGWPPAEGVMVWALLLSGAALLWAVVLGGVRAGGRGR
jgi:uncharacterized iron-regulated membrane protein